MDVTQRVQLKLEKILARLKALKIIQTFELKINFCQIEEGTQANLKEIDSILKKCLKRIMAKPKRAEIRNVITELVRKKNLNHACDRSPENAPPCFDRENLNLTKLFEHRKNNKKKKRILRGKVAAPSVVVPAPLLSPKTSSKQFLCEICGKTFNELASLKSHKGRHANMKIFQCQHCFVNLTCSRELNEHYCSQIREPIESSRESLNVSPFPCLNGIENSFFGDSIADKEQICEKRPSREEKVKEPLTGTVSAPSGKTGKKILPPYICSWCGKVFRLKESLRKHESVKHSTGVVELECPTCQKVFFERGKLNRHMLGHEAGRFECPSCPRRFARSDALKRHLSVTHGRVQQYPCTFCQRKFNFKYNRDVHEKNVHKNTNNAIECVMCKEKFKTKIALRNHMKIHSSQRVACQICNKSFARKLNFDKHMKSSHFGIFPVARKATAPG